MEGRSFAPALRGNSIDDRTAMTISDNGTMYGCRTEEWKYITRIDEEEKHLFDLEDNPAETEEIHADHPEVTDRFESIISAYRERIDTNEQADVDYDPEVEQRLADLGYK
jgi:arylsulfatase A-like enzyme